MEGNRPVVGTQELDHWKHDRRTELEESTAILSISPLARSAIRKTGVVALDIAYLTNPSALRYIYELLETGTVCGLYCLDQNQIIFFRKRIQLLGLSSRKSKRLLRDHMHAILKSSPRIVEMSLIRRSDIYGIHLLQ